MAPNKSDEEKEFEFNWIQKRKEVGLPDVDLSMFAEETGFEKLQRKFKENPLVPIGALMTACCLTLGLLSMRRGDRVMSQRMMRGRILAQGFTIAAMLTGIIYKTSQEF